MSLLKNHWFWVSAGIIAVVVAYLTRSVSTVGFMACYILVPAAIGIAVRIYLDKIQSFNEWTDADWRPYEEGPKVETKFPFALRS